MKNRYLITFITVIVLFQAFSVQAKLPKPTWQSGKLVFWDKTILEGDLCYNWLLQTVLFQYPDGRLRTFSARQVSQFGWFDFSEHRYRNFKVLNTTEVANHHRFFEICQDGSLVVVRQLRQLRGLRKHVFTHPAYYADQPNFAQNTDFFDYFVYDAGRLRAIDRFYSDVYVPLMTTYDKQLQHYVDVHNINDRSLSGRLLLINRYNTMVEQDAKTASSKPFGVAPE